MIITPAYIFNPCQSWREREMDRWTYLELGIATEEGNGEVLCGARLMGIVESASQSATSLIYQRETFNSLVARLHDMVE